MDSKKTSNPVISVRAGIQSSATEAAILNARGLSIGYQQRRVETVVADDLDLALNAGELVCLLGPNGAGKSTLMRTLAGMQPPLDGCVWLDARPLAEYTPQELAQKLSVVLTERIDVGLLSAYALVALGRYPYTDWRGRLSADDTQIIDRAIRAVGAEPLAARPVSQLSDGERQKVMIARALAQEPTLMLLDEPTAFLDLPRRVEIMQILRRLAHEDGRAVLLSTHDLDLALRSADKLWLMTEGEIHVGAPEDLVLDGTFARAFASEGVMFDAASGAFRMQVGDQASVGLVGEGVRYEWTRRALERAGFRIVKEGAAMSVQVNGDGWELEGREFESLGELLAQIKL